MSFATKAHQIAFGNMAAPRITDLSDNFEMTEGGEICFSWSLPYGWPDAEVNVVLDGSVFSGAVNSYCLVPSLGSHSLWVERYGVRSNVISFTVIPDETPLTVNLDSPSNGYYESGNMYTVYWSVSEGSDYGDVYQDGSLIGSGTSGTVNMTYSGGTVSLYVVVNGVSSNTVTMQQCTLGCTDPSAANYDSGATCDDGSCNYCTNYGCTDPNASNYNPSADCNDGSCVYYPTVVTITNPPDGQSFADGESFTVYWTVDRGSDYAVVYSNGVYMGEGSGSSGVTFAPYGGQPYSIYVQTSDGGVVSNTITIYTS